MKYISTVLFLFVLNSFAYGQKKEKEKEEVPDTISNTKIEKLLRQTSVIKKVEFVEVEKVKVLKFEIIIITDLKTSVKIKGLYLSNPKGERHAYLDENEIDDLIFFLESCDRKWKNEKPQYRTQYEFESLDNVRISFWTDKDSKSWEYSVTFSNYVFNNTAELKKSQSDELLDALKQVKSELDKH